MSKCVKIILVLGAIIFVGYWVAEILTAVSLGGK
jgi:hypothetical protein